jgi:mRNA-degrading endonuclease RelE of RelBE toxin-antitoxin system
MKKYKIEFTDRFRKEIKKLSNQDQSLVLKTVKIMEDDPYYNSTKTKK